MKRILRSQRLALTLPLCAAAMAVSQVTAQVATKEASAVILPATNALWSVAGGTNALQERVAVLQMRRAPFW